jgi:hypothetical protein
LRDQSVKPRNAKPPVGRRAHLLPKRRPVSPCQARGPVVTDAVDDPAPSSFEQPGQPGPASQSPTATLTADRFELSSSLSF